jgi:hypothetical protein
MNTIDITPLVNAFLTLLASIITIYLVPWLKARAAEAKHNLSENQLWVYQTLAHVAVSAAEQIYSDNSQKLDYAMQVFEHACAEKGIAYDSAVARAYIEDAVRGLKDVGHMLDAKEES